MEEQKMPESDEKTAKTVDEPSARRCLGGFFDLVFSVSMYLFVVMVVIWNCDDFWQSNIPSVQSFLEKTFPGKYVREQLKSDSQAKNIPLFIEMRAQILELEKANTEQRNLWRYYDSSFRMVGALKEKLTGEEREKCFRYADKYTLGIWEEKTEAHPESFSVGDE